MAYVIGKRVTSRRWAEIRKIRFGAYAALLAGCAVIVGLMNGSAIYSISPFKFAKAGGQYNQGPEQAVKSNKKNSSKPKPKTSANVVGASQAGGQSSCALTDATLSGFEGSISPEIRKLSEFEKVCGGKFIENTMLFTSMPINMSEASTMAVDTSYRLKEFAKYGLSPVIIMEPITSSGFVNFPAYASGANDTVMSAYFSKLKATGITDQMLGTLVPFPEANIPEWGNTNPSDVAGCITKTAQLQKEHFPASQTSVLLDSKSYPRGNSWAGGSYTSLLPYVASIPKGLIDSFGLQGYPWPDPQPEHNPVHFLSANMAIEAANVLGVKGVWFNTGTFNKGKGWNGQTFSLTPTQRSDILTQIISQAKSVKANGYQTSVMLFAENKFSTAEGIDWSYWPAGNPSGEGVSVFKAFQLEARNAGLGLGIFDS